MRVICDAPGQTCNRLWTYVASVAQCVAERKKMTILFFDWTIEDFPHLLHCPFIYFPLWHKWYLERGNGWNNYKGLTWKVTHNKRWDKIFKLLGFTKGWSTRNDIRYLQQTLPELQRIFRPKDEIMQRAKDMMSVLRAEADMVVGIHIRRGDYATWHDGRFFYELEDYHQFMLRIQEVYKDRRVAFFISSNEDFDVDRFEGCWTVLKAVTVDDSAKSRLVLSLIYTHWHYVTAWQVLLAATHDGHRLLDVYHCVFWSRKISSLAMTVSRASSTSFILRTARKYLIGR